MRIERLTAPWFQAERFALFQGAAILSKSQKPEACDRRGTLSWLALLRSCMPKCVTLLYVDKATIPH